MKQMDRMKEIVAQLRAPDGCPWDQKQTHETLRAKLLEETHEVMQAITHEDMANLEEELGDVLLHIFLHAEIASERDVFSIESVTEKIINKLIRRHPHVFGEARAQSAEEVSHNWELIKEQEKKNKQAPKAPFCRIPLSLPPLNRAYELGKTAGKSGFDWPSSQEVLAKVREELTELEEALDQNDARQESKDNKNQQKVTEEFGDFLFSLVQWGRHHHLDAGDALYQANYKFQKRYENMLAQLDSDPTEAMRQFHVLTHEQKESLWFRAKTSNQSS